MMIARATAPATAISTSRRIRFHIHRLFVAWWPVREAPAIYHCPRPVPPCKIPHRSWLGTLRRHASMEGTPMISGKFLSAAVAALLLTITLSTPAADAAKLPPDEGKAKDRLNSSPRHGEWVDIPVE